MPPCSTPSENMIGDRSTRSADSIQLAELRKCIPESAFQKSAVKSMMYMVFDYLMWFGTVFAMVKLCSNPMWNNFSTWQQGLITLVYWNLAGFFMWCIFIIGHDCGHGTFSNSETFNDIIGHLTHGSILVPYYPWQLSHRRHHMYHNHAEKDYSYPWYTADKFNRPDENLARMLHNQPALIFFFPFYGWPIYLYGLPDGSHLFPFKNDRLWKDTPSSESVKCLISSGIVLLNLVAVYFLCGQSFANVMFYYFPPWILFGWWLVTVTYLQHHDPETLVYDDKDWKFVTSAFETVDRVFGFGIDTLHHHITDGHVAHHLFFTKIPHYNLPAATKALRAYLEEKGLSHVYKRDNTMDFVYRVHKYFVTNGFRSHRASEQGKKIN